MAHTGSRFLSWVIVVIALTLTACDSDGRKLTATAFLGAPSPIVSAHLSPATLPLVSVAGFGCPFLQPFLTEFDLIVDGRGSDFMLDSVGFDFDAAGFMVPPLQLTLVDLRARFGDTLIRAGSSRAFRLSQPFGCGLARAPRSLGVRGTLLAVGGATHQFSLVAPIR